MFKTISIIIPVKPGNSNPSVLDHLKAVDYPKDNIEIIVVSGNNPSLQRNKAVQIAKGEILYFLNSDAQVPPDIFSKIDDIFNKRGDIAGVGGPDLTPADNDRLQYLFGLAMSSFFAHWKMRARYSQIGKERLGDERQLLLSNLAMKKEAFLGCSGFNETLYPNEENELIDRMIDSGYRFLYSPRVKIYRSRRKTLPLFVRQFYRYGRGRMRQIFIEGVKRNLVFFLPVLFLVYLILLPFLKPFTFYLVPLSIYIAFSLGDTLYFFYKNRTAIIFFLPFIYIIMHLCYAAGMVSSLGQRYRGGRDKSVFWAGEVTVQRIGLSGFQGGGDPRRAYELQNF